MNLHETTALVTGGSSGIGRAIAEILIAAGSRVAITGRDEKKLNDTAQAIGALPIRADVTNEADVQRTYREFFDKFGHLDILINNAGFGTFKNLVDQDLASFESIFRTNVVGPMLMAREATKHFITRDKGNIVNIASTSALKGSPRGTAYYASKFALRGMNECWRAELRKYNIRVFLINPSEVITNFADVAGNAQNKQNETKLRPEEIAHAVKSVLEMNDRGFITELTVFATNPQD